MQAVGGLACIALATGCAASGSLDDGDDGDDGEERVAENVEAIETYKDWAVYLTPGLPGGVGKITLGGTWGDCTVDPYCYGTLVTPRHVLTAAHCFRNKSPSTFSGQAFGQAFASGDVTFHPAAWSDGATTWTSVRSAADLRYAHDLALIRLPSAVTSTAPAKLFHPGGPAAENQFTSTLGTFGGPDTSASPEQPGTAERTGQTLITGVKPAWQALAQPPDASNHPGELITTATALMGFSADPPIVNSRLSLNGEDFGTGLFLDAPTESNIPPSSCPAGVSFGATGQRVLIGVAASVTIVDWDISHPDDVPAGQAHIGHCNVPHQTYGDIPSANWVPVYDDDHIKWLVDATDEDIDDDWVCDNVDNCVEVKNPNQENCNKHAEHEWGGGIELGDACDPAPCPRPVLADESTYQATPGSTVTMTQTGSGSSATHTIYTYEVTKSEGIEIRDKVAIVPILGTQFPQVTVSTAMRFCDCRDPATWKPRTSINACKILINGHNCRLDPRQIDGNYTEVKPADATAAPYTAWYKMTLGGVVDAGFPNLKYPQIFASTVHKTWGYVSDRTKWIDTNDWIAPAPGSGLYPDATDIGGMLWGHAPTRRGASAHGLPSETDPSCSPGSNVCSIADGYVAGIAPEMRAERRSNISIRIPYATVPFYLDKGDPAPLYDTYFYPAPLPIVTVDPVSKDATIWQSQRGGQPYEHRMSPALREALGAAPRTLVVESRDLVACSSAPCVPSTPAIAVETATASTLAVVGPSEPWLAAKTGKSWGGQDPPLGIVLEASNATINVRRIAYTEAAGYALLSWTSLPATASEWLVAGSARATLRDDVALAWSRTTGTLYAVAGPSPLNAAAGATLQMYAVTTTQAVLVGPLRLPLRKTAAAVYSPKDGKLWVLDDQAPLPGAHAWRLLRIDATSGAVYTDIALPALSTYGRAWLTTLATGEIILVVAPTYDEHGSVLDQGYRIVKLDSDRDSSSPKVFFEGMYWGSAYVVTGPMTASDRVTIGLERYGQTAGSREVLPRAVRSSDISLSFPDLERDLELANAAP